MSSKVGIILVNYKDYATRFLADCRDSLRAQNYSDYQVYIVDNATSSESKKYLQENYAEAKIIENINNDGFAKGNNDGMKVALADGCEYIFLLNMDTVIEPGALLEMVKVAETEQKIGAVQARLMLASHEGGNLVHGNKINSLGNITHFLGFGYSLGYGEEWKGRASQSRGGDFDGAKHIPAVDAHPVNPLGCHPSKEGNLSSQPSAIPEISGFTTLQVGELKEIAYPSGAAVLFKKEALSEVGLFDEEYWMYNEDQELGWRLWLSGWKCVLASEAVVYHKYEFSRSISKYYWMDRNRLLAIFECYEPLTLVLIMPALMIMELGLTLFSLQNGSFSEKLKVWKYFLSYDNWEKIKKARKRNQSLRKVRDKELKRLITGKIWYQEVGDWKLRLVNPVFNAYWALVKVVLTFF